MSRALFRRLGLIQTRDRFRLKKPDWVIKQVIQIKALHSQAGCRAIANIFNSRFENHKSTPETISKSFVANTLKNHLYDIQIIRRNIKSKPALESPKYLIHCLGIAAKTKGMTEVAKKAGVTRSSLYQSLDGSKKPKFETIEKVMDALNIKLTVERKIRIA